jgi:hypothetical protein
MRLAADLYNARASYRALDEMDAEPPVKARSNHPAARRFLAGFGGGRLPPARNKIRKRQS